MKSDFDSVGTAGNGVAAERRGGVCGKGREPGERRWKTWLEAARARGTSERELVVELHLCRGLPLEKVAEVLGAKLETVNWLWRQSRANTVCGMSTPRSKEDFVVLREQVGAMMWQTVVETCLALDADEGDAPTSTKRTVSLLGVRLKALRQIAVLYGVEPKAKAKARKPSHRQVECATPEEIARLVRERLEERRREGVGR